MDLGKPTLPSSSYRLFPSVRLLMVTLAFLGLTAINCGFASFNFGIVCMTNSTTNVGKDAGCFDWDPGTRANLLAAYSWGCVITSIPAGWLCDKYGGRYVYLIALLVATLSISLSPWAAFQGVPYLFAARLINGLAGGIAWPSVVQMASRWGHPSERAFLIAYGTVGAPFGQLITSPMAGVLCKSESLGWPSIFYIWAGFCGLTSLLWFLIYADGPERCRFIGRREREYLIGPPTVSNQKATSKKGLWAIPVSPNMAEAQSGHRSLQIQHPEAVQKATRKTPWCSIFFSRASLAIYSCHFCNLWLTIFSNEFVPTYQNEILHLDITSNGFYAALPILAQVIACVLFGSLADRIVCGSRSRTFVVKFFNTLCMGVPCAGLLALAFLDASSGVGVAIFCLCLCTFFLATSTASFIRCMVLIAPEYSGTISSISNVYSNAACIIMPYVTGAVTKDGSASGWQVAFYIGLGLSAFGCVEFLIFGSAEEQRWAKGSSDGSWKDVVEKRPTKEMMQF